MAKKSSPITVEIQPSSSGHYATISLNRHPVNALVPGKFAVKFYMTSLNVAEAITEGIVSIIDSLESNSSVKGFILTSSINGYFSAGIDLSLFVGKWEDFLKFWMGLRKMFLRIYESRLVSIACIQGHAPGGGTIMALACHYRFMINGKSTIGLNEVAVGLPVPRWLCDVFVQTVGARNAERLLPLGMTFNAHKAKSIRLVDEIFDAVDLMKEAAVAQLEHCFRVNQGVRHKTMHWIRKDFADKMRREEALESAGHEAVVNPEFQKTVRKIIASLSENRTKPKSNL